MLLKPNALLKNLNICKLGVMKFNKWLAFWVSLTEVWAELISRDE